MLTITWNYNRDPHQNCFAVATNVVSAWRLVCTLKRCMGSAPGDILNIEVRNVQGVSVWPLTFEEMCTWSTHTHKDDWMD
jgi:hypothetical protein